MKPAVYCINKSLSMKLISTTILKLIIMCTAIAALYILIRFPQTEGRAANLDILSIYTDPIIIYIYIASNPFFAALYQTFKLVENFEMNKIKSLDSINRLKIIKYCGLAIVVFMLVAETYLFTVQRYKSDDIAGGVMMGFLIKLVSSSISFAASFFQSRLFVMSGRNSYLK